jgi:uncharacterized integral membrane protein
MMRRIASVLVIVAVVALLSNTASAQCAMCRRALQSPEGQQMIGAFRSGILFLLVAPFAIFGTVATLAVRRFRRKSANA